MRVLKKKQFNMKISLDIVPGNEIIDDGYGSGCFRGIRKEGRKFFGDLEVMFSRTSSGGAQISQDEFRTFGGNGYRCSICNGGRIRHYLVTEEEGTRYVDEFYSLYPNLKSKEDLHGLAICNGCDFPYLLFHT